VVVPALRRLGLWRLDALAVSHRHPDHAGGAGAVRRLMGGEDLVPAPSTLGAASTRVRALGGGVLIRAVNPPPGEAELADARDENDRSLALLLSYGETGVVLTGDAGPRVAARLAAAATPHPPRLVLQAPHHGASAEACRVLAESLQPQVAVIPVGRNTYGHPQRGAVAALALSARVLRSDRDGAVFVHSDGVGLAVRTWRELACGRTWPERVRWLVAGW
jgi:competence protein ComEC